MADGTKYDIDPELFRQHWGDDGDNKDVGAGTKPNGADHGATNNNTNSAAWGDPDMGVVQLHRRTRRNSRSKSFVTIGAIGSPSSQRPLPVRSIMPSHRYLPVHRR